MYSGTLVHDELHSFSSLNSPTHVTQKRNQVRLVLSDVALQAATPCHCVCVFPFLKVRIHLVYRCTVYNLSSHPVW